MTFRAQEPTPPTKDAKSPGSPEKAENWLAGAVDHLDAMGAMLAELEGVGGVETRDPGLFGATVTQPELVVYTTPPFLEAVEARGRALASALGLSVQVSPEVRTDDDWRDSWKNFYTHIILGQGDLLLRPSWLERRPGDPEAELVLDPGRAFGTGYHESTRLCLELLMARARDGRRADRVLDLGCGSGILGLAWARRMGPSVELILVDIDPEAVETARENAALNQTLERCDFYVGGADAVDERFELVIANIRPEVLIPHAPAIASRVAPGGELLLSGILAEEAASVIDAYERLTPAFELSEQAEMNDWVALRMRRGDST